MTDSTVAPTNQQPADDHSLLARAAACSRAGRGVAVARVVATWGSSPRPVGSVLVVDGDGRMSGSVSGGCVEAAVAQAADTVIASGEPRALEFGVSDAEAWGVGLACGGQIRVYLQPVGVASGGLDPTQIDVLGEDVGAGRGVVLATRLSDGASYVVTNASGRDLAEAAATVLATDRSRVTQVDGDEWFLHALQPPLRLVIVGGVHIAQVLQGMAAQAGYRVTVVDPRTAFATSERFPGAEIVDDWPGSAMAALRPDPRSAVVALSHDPKLDDPALQAALASDAFYVGALGSRRTHAARRRRLAEAGVPEVHLQRIHAPVGLDIGARSPAEIAVSILAEMTHALRRGPVTAADTGTSTATGSVWKRP